MTNQIALRVHCGRSSEFLCEADCHIYHYEQGAFAQLSGLVAQTVAGEGGVLRVDQLKNLIRPENEHMVRTQLICLERIHTTAGVAGFNRRKQCRKSAIGPRATG